MENRPTIPFVKAVQVGNYKLWRSKVKIAIDPSDEDRKKVREESGGKRRAATRTIDMEQIHVSNLDGSWSVTIPQTSMMYANICEGYAIANEKERDSYLTMIFGNFINVTLNTNQALHDGLYFLTEMLTYPYLLLPEKEMEKRMKTGYKAAGIDNATAKKQIGDMIKYRRELYEHLDKKIADYLAFYESELEKGRLKEEESQEALRQDEIAEQAMDVINEKGED